MAKDLLLEIGTEEIPARFMEPALRLLAATAKELLETARLNFGKIAVFGTPRRLTLLVEEVAEMAEDLKMEFKGPAVKSAYDAEGSPTKALEGFCRSQGIEPADLFIKELNGVPYVYAAKNAEGKAAVAILPQLFLDIINKLNFPKTMRWGDLDMRFARPLHWLVALYGKEVLPLEVAGIAADRYSRGHRFLGNDKVEIKSPAHYKEALRKEYVIVDQKERRQMIAEQIKEVAKTCGGKTKEDDALLNEVTYLLEYPTAFAGFFNEDYLSMPTELIITPMREHQRYFPVFRDDNTLLNNFIAIRNGTAKDINIVQEGNEKVLRSRLADAAFFWHEDCKHPLEDNSPALAKIVFHEKLGTVAQKVVRVSVLAGWLATELDFSLEEATDTARAAELMKCDLVSSVVCEFTELQGIMGKYYARHDGEREAVAQAIEEHYLPRFAADELPTSKAGMVLSIADKMDSLVGFFGLGMQPTGSQDPYALRRQAAGIANMIIKYGLNISLPDLIDVAFALHVKNQLPKSKEEVQETLGQFFGQRLGNILNEEGISYDIVNAILAISLESLNQSRLKAHALASFRTTVACQEMLAGFNRAANLVKGKDFGQVEEKLFIEEAEKTLFKAIVEAENKIAENLKKQDYLVLLESLGGLRGPIDQFFDKVMVMTEDENIRNNRLALLGKVVKAAKNIGDLSQLVT